MPYRFGADGSDGHIDCIHMCYQALERMGIDAPAFKQSWYEARAKWEICRDLCSGVPVYDRPYDGPKRQRRLHPGHLQSHGRRESCTSMGMSVKLTVVRRQFTIPLLPCDERAQDDWDI